MRLIDADKLINELDYIEPDKEWYESQHETWLDCRLEVINAPIVDAVEVVRCKDCRAYLPPTEVRDWGICRRHSTPMRDNNFCNYGEREEHE